MYLKWTSGSSIAPTIPRKKWNIPIQEYQKGKKIHDQKFKECTTYYKVMNFTRRDFPESKADNDIRTFSRLILVKHVHEFVCSDCTDILLGRNHNNLKILTKISLQHFIETFQRFLRSKGTKVLDKPLWKKNKGSGMEKGETIEKNQKKLEFTKSTK